MLCDAFVMEGDKMKTFSIYLALLNDLHVENKNKKNSKPNMIFNTNFRISKQLFFTFDKAKKRKQEREQIKRVD